MAGQSDGGRARPVARFARFGKVSDTGAPGRSGRGVVRCRRGEEGPAFLEVLGRQLIDGDTGLDMIVVATIRSDRYEPLQTAPQLADVQSHLFDRLRRCQLPSSPRSSGPGADGTSRQHRSSPLLRSSSTDSSKMPTAGADTLPLLALTLARLYEDYAGSGVAVTVDNYEAMGGMRRVVQNEIDNLLSAEPG